jgi:hypothetical protein
VFEKICTKNTDKFNHLSYSMDFWHRCLGAARHYLKGWNANKSREAKKEKRDILSKLKEMDRDLDSQGGDDRLWVERYQLEGKLEQIFQKEEGYWQQRGSERWVLMGDANTKFFHRCKWQEEKNDLLYRNQGGGPN